MNILLIGNNEKDNELIEKTLSSCDDNVFSLKSVRTLADGIQELTAGDYDVLLLDAILDDSPKEKTMEWMNNQNIPIVILSTMQGGDVVSDFLSLGVQEILDKSKLNKELLEHCLLHARERWRVNKNIISSELRESEQALRNFKKAVDNSSDAIGMATASGKHFYQNGAFSELFGLSVEQAEGQSGPPSTVYVDENIGREVFKTIMEGNVWTGEVEMYGSQKDILNILLRAYSIKDDNGTILSLIGIHTDITKKKIAEKKLKDNLNDLENFKNIAIEREHMMIELKKEVNKLSEEAGKSAPYDLTFLE